MNKDVVVAIAAVVAILLICFGVAAMKPAYPPIESHPFAAGGGAAFGGPVVLHVNGEAITQKEFEAYLAAAPEQARTFASSPQGRRLLADQLVQMKVLEQQGRKLGVEKDSQISSDIAAQTALMRANAAATFALRKLVGEPSEADLRAAYDKQNAAAPGERQVRHILISCGESQIPPRSGGQVSCEQALQKAQQVAAAIHSRADFERAAREVSDDTASGAEGGLLGPLRPGSMPPEVEQAITSLPPDQVSRPVRTQYGFHLFSVSAPEPEPFSKVRPMLEQRWKQEKLKEIVSSAAKDAKVEYDEKYFGPASPPLPNAPAAAKRAS